MDVSPVLQAEIDATRRLLASYDMAIGQLYEARKDAVDLLWKLEGRLTDSTPERGDAA